MLARSLFRAPPVFAYYTFSTIETLYYRSVVLLTAAVMNTASLSAAAEK